MVEASSSCSAPCSNGTLRRTHRQRYPLSARGVIIAAVWSRACVEPGDSPDGSAVARLAPPLKAYAAACHARVEASQNDALHGHAQCAMNS
eukprot:6193761-Pleurochrysis_carterae.AAC.4